MFDIIKKIIQSSHNNEETKSISLKAIIENAPDISELSETTDPEGLSLMHYAALNDEAKVIETLIDADLSINKLDTKGRTAFDIAYINGNTKVLKTLYKKLNGQVSFNEIKLKSIESLHEVSTDFFDKQNSKGETLLHLAVKGRDKEAVQTLMSYGAQPIMNNNENQTPTDIAIKLGDNQILSLLLKIDGIDQNHHIGSPTLKLLGDLDKAIHSNDFKKAKSILDKDRRLLREQDAEGKTLLHIAAEKQNFELLKLVIGYAPNIYTEDKNHKTAFHYADENNFKEFFGSVIANIGPQGLMHYAIEQNLSNMVQALFQLPFILLQVSNSQTPIERAVELGRIEILEMILRSPHASDKYKKLLETHNNLLHIAAEENWVKVVEEMLKNNNNSLVDAKNDSQQTPMHIAINKDDIAIVKLLLEHEADIVSKDVEDADGNTPLMLALTQGSQELIDLFINEHTFNNKYGDHCLLYWASKHGYTNHVEKLIELGASVNHNNNKDNTALHIASQEGHHYIVKLLLDKGALINSIGCDKYTPMHYAVLNKRHEVIQTLIENGADLNLQNSNGYTPLHLAAKHGDNKSVELLLASNRANAYLLDNSEDTPLTLAAHEGHLDVVETLINCYKIKKAWKDISGNKMPTIHIAAVEGWVEILKAYSDSNSLSQVTGPDKVFPLYLASRCGKQEAIKYLMKENVPLNQTVKDGNTALHVAIKYNKLKEAEILLKNGAKIKQAGHNGHTALHYAVKANNIEATKLLLKYKADCTIVNKDGYSPLQKALNDCNIEILKVLLPQIPEYKNKIENKNTLLHIATERGWTEIVAKLMESKPNLNIKNSSGQTPLDIALNMYNMNIYKILTNGNYSNLTVNTKFQNGSTLIHRAIKEDDIKLLKLLISRSVNLDIKDANGYTPIYFAVSLNKNEAVKLLANSGANINDILYNKMNLAHFAALKGNLEALKSLVEDYKVSVSTLSPEGKNLLHYAVLSDKVEMVNFLVSKGVAKTQIDYEGNTAMHLAAARDNVAIFDAVFDASQLNTQNKFGQTALYIAVEEGSSEIATKLLTQGASATTKVSQTNSSPLHAAVKSGSLSIVKALIEQGGENINVQDNLNRTALFLAAQKGNLEMVEYLLSKNPDFTLNSNINTNLSNVSPLYIAAANGHFNIVQKLVEKGIDINIKASDSTAAIYKAIYNKHFDIAEYLVDKGVNINEKYFGETLLTLSIKQKGQQFAEKLVNKGADLNQKNDNNYSPLYLALENGLFYFAKILLSKEINIDEKNGPKNSTALHVAAYKEQQEIVQALINKGAKIEYKDTEERTVLHFAAQENNINILNLLISKVDDINVKNKLGNTPLYYALIFAKNSKIAEILIQHGASLDYSDDFGQSYMHIAAKDGMAPLISILKAKGLNINQMDKNGFTPLHKAVYLEEPLTTEQLIKNGADINAVTKEGLSALHLVCKTSEIKLLQLLLEYCINSNATDPTGKTALHYAVEREKEAFVKELLDYEAEHIKDASGNTPLHLAAQKGLYSIVEILLEHGANVHEENNLGQTPLSLALTYTNSLLTIESLLAHQANLNSKVSNEDTSTIIKYLCKSKKIDALKLVSKIVPDTFKEANQVLADIPEGREKDIFKEYIEHPETLEINGEFIDLWS